MISLALTWNLSGWVVYSDAYQVRVTGPQIGSGAAPVGAVIDFDDSTGRTIASAHVHHIFPTDDPRRVVSAQALQAYRDDGRTPSVAAVETPKIAGPLPAAATPGEFASAAQRLAQTFSCGSVPKIVAKGERFETYSVDCRRPEPVMLRCDSVSCTELR